MSSSWPKWHRTYPKPSIRVPHSLQAGPRIQLIEISERTLGEGNPASAILVSLPSHLLSPLLFGDALDNLNSFNSEFAISTQGTPSSSSPLLQGHIPPTIATHRQGHSRNLQDLRGSKSPPLTRLLGDLQIRISDADSSGESMGLAQNPSTFDSSQRSTSRLVQWSTGLGNHPEGQISTQLRVAKDTSGRGGDSPPLLSMGPSPPAISPLHPLSMTPPIASWGPSPSTMQLSPPMMVTPPMFKYGMDYRGIQEQLVG